LHPPRHPPLSPAAAAAGLLTSDSDDGDRGGDGDGDAYYGEVQSLQEALDSKFDSFYASRGRLSWERCEEAYVRESEGVEFGAGDGVLLPLSSGGNDGEGRQQSVGQDTGTGEEGFMWHEVAVEL